MYRQHLKSRHFIIFEINPGNIQPTLSTLKRNNNNHHDDKILPAHLAFHYPSKARRNCEIAKIIDVFTANSQPDYHG